MTTVLHGFGLGLRPQHYDALLAGGARVDWLEILSENYLVEGGRPLWMLDRMAERWPVVRIPPHRARAFAVAIGKVAKTDPIDAAVLARLAAVVDGPEVTPLRAVDARLQALVRRREQLVAQRDDERRRQQQATDRCVRSSLLRHIRQLRRHVKKLQMKSMQKILI